MPDLGLGLSIGHPQSRLAKRDSIPQNSVAPVISGDTAIGSVLSCTTGTWTETPTSYTYQWNVNGSAVGGATSSTWSSAGSVADSVTCDVVAHNATKDSSAKRSNVLLLSAPAFDADAAAFFTAASITDATQKSAVNQFVLALKAGSLWTKLTALYPFVGAAATPHSFNLKNPAAYQITWHGTITHNTNGITGDGSTGYGDTNLLRNVLPQSLAQMSTYVRAYGPSNFKGIGGVDNFLGSPNQFTDLNHFFGQTQVRINGVVAGGGTSVASANGFLIGTRLLDDSGCALLMDGSSFSSVAEIAPDGNLALSIYILGLNRGGFVTDIDDSNLALFCAGNALSLSDAIAFRTAVNTFQTTLGRNV